MSESLLRFSLTGAILTLNDELADATREYAAASATLATAVIEEAEARQVLAWHETIKRDWAYTTGLPGTNEGARRAALDRMLLTDNDLAGLRSRQEEAQRARVLAEHHFRVVDQAQKSLRVRLDALAALVRQP